MFWVSSRYFGILLINDTTTPSPIHVRQEDIHLRGKHLNRWKWRYNPGSLFFKLAGIDRYHSSIGRKVSKFLAHKSFDPAWHEMTSLLASMEWKLIFCWSPSINTHPFCTLHGYSTVCDWGRVVGVVLILMSSLPASTGDTFLGSSRSMLIWNISIYSVNMKGRGGYLHILLDILHLANWKNQILPDIYSNTYEQWGAHFPFSCWLSCKYLLSLFIYPIHHQLF